MSSSITCAAQGCSNVDDSHHEKKGITFHRFPHALRETDRLRQWLLNVKRKKAIPLSNSYLCSEHFTEDCFDKNSTVIKLKPDSFPTSFCSRDLHQNDTQVEYPASTRIAEIASDVKMDLWRSERLKARRSSKKSSDRLDKKEHLFTFMDTIGVDTKQQRDKQGRQRRTDLHLPVPIMIMDPAVSSVTGTGSERNISRKEENNLEGTQGSLRKIPVLIMDPELRSVLEARHKESSKQRGNNNVVTFWPVSAPYVGDCRDQSPPDRSLRLDHPYTTSVSVQEKLTETSPEQEICEKQLSEEQQRADRSKNQEEDGFYTSIHDEMVVIKIAETYKKEKKKQRETKKKGQKAATDISMIEIEPIASDTEIIEESICNFSSDTAVIEESICDVQLINLPEEPGSLRSQFFQVSSSDDFKSEFHNNGVNGGMIG